MDKIKQEAERRSPIKKGDDNVAVTISFEKIMQSHRKEFEAGATYAQSLQRPRWVKASKENMTNMGVRHWRDEQKNPIGSGMAYIMIKRGDFVEYLDERRWV